MFNCHRAHPGPKMPISPLLCVAYSLRSLSLHLFANEPVLRGTGRRRAWWLLKSNCSGEKVRLAVLKQMLCEGWIISDMTVHYYILQAHIWMTISLCQLYSFRTLADPSLASASSVFRVRHWSVSHSWEGKKKVKAASVGVFWVKTGGISHELVAEAAHQWSEPDGISGVL